MTLLARTRNAARIVATRCLPQPVSGRLRTLYHRLRMWPRVGALDWGGLRRLHPISRDYGYDRGMPIDRYYIERFLAGHCADIHGRVLEIADDTYTMQFGKDAVATSDVLHVVPGNPKSTIIADLTNAPHVPDESFDCIILTQTLQFIFDTRASIRTLHRILAPGGVLLATFPGISRIKADGWPDYWRFTSRSAQGLFGEAFLPQQVAVETFGSVLVAGAFLYGLAVEELTPDELAFRDAEYELLVAVRAVKTV